MCHSISFLQKPLPKHYVEDVTPFPFRRLQLDIVGNGGGNGETIREGHGCLLKRGRGARTDSGSAIALKHSLIFLLV
jgi:hypothetical protein